MLPWPENVDGVLSERKGRAIKAAVLSVGSPTIRDELISDQLTFLGLLWNMCHTSLLNAQPC